MKNNRFASLASVMVLLLAGSAQAQIVTNNLSVYFRADNVDGAGNPGDPATTNLVNLANPGIYNGTIVNGSGVVANAGQAGTPFAYGVPLTSASLTRIEANTYFIAGGTNYVAAATWEFWLRLDANAADSGALYGEFRSTAQSSTRHFLRPFPSSGDVDFDEYTPSGGYAPSGNGCFTAGVFLQLVITKNDTTVSFYTNGTLFATGTSSEKYTAASCTRTYFGVRPMSTPAGTDGQFNIIRVYDRALSDAEVLQNYYLDSVGTTNLALRSSSNPSVVGSNVTFTASVQTNGLTVGNATGTVVFKDGTTPFSTNDVIGGVTTCNTRTLSLGTHTIWAEYSGDGYYFPITNRVVQLVNPYLMATTTALGSSGSPSWMGSNVTFTATVKTNGVTVGDATGAVVFKEGLTALSTNSVSSGVAAYTNNTLFAGARVITAQYLGDTNYAGSISATVTQFVQAVTTLALTSSVNPMSAGDTCGTLTATVLTNGATAPGALGTVVFKNGGTPLSTNNVSGGVATFPTRSLPLGTSLITAEYSGDGYYLRSTNSPPLEQVVTPGSRRMIRPVAADAWVKVTEGNRHIDRTIDGSGLSGPNLCKTDWTLDADAPPHANPFSTANAWEAGYNDGATSPNQMQANTWAMWNLGANYDVTGLRVWNVQNNCWTVPVPPACRQTLTVDLLVSSLANPGNPLANSWNWTLVTTNLDVRALTSTIGVYIALPNLLNVRWVGWTNLTAPPQYGLPPYDTGSHYVECQEIRFFGTKTTTVALQSSLNPSTNGNNVTFTATVQTNGVTVGDAAGVVVFQDGGTPIGTNTLSNGVTTFSTSSLAAGLRRITAVYGGDAGLNITYPGSLSGSSGSLLQTVLLPGQRPSTTTLASSASPSVPGSSVTLTATVQTNGVAAGSASGSMIFSLNGNPVATNTVSGGVAAYTTDPLAVGSYAVTAEYSGNAGYGPSLGTLAQAVGQVFWSVSGSLMSISWPDYPGWILQQQTNGLSVGLGANWVDIPGTEWMTAFDVPLDAAPAVFYRLRHP